MWSSRPFDPAGLTFVNCLLSISQPDPQTSHTTFKYTRVEQTGYFFSWQTYRYPTCNLMIILSCVDASTVVAQKCARQKNLHCSKGRARETTSIALKLYCAGHLFLACLIRGRAEWQRGDFSITLMRGKLKPTAWGLQHHYRGKKVWIHLAGPRF